ncbi:hypothetical protein, partial [Kaistella sp.]|uniref:hypothetical protein n=1 Tax=Kaistella sp. TaxID=2782235 RepID=UPI003C5AFB97
FTEKQLLKNQRVLDFSTEEQTTPELTVKFLKCIKTESHLQKFKNLPFFTGRLPLIVDKRLSKHNDEMWETIHQECKDKTIFNKL